MSTRPCVYLQRNGARRPAIMPGWKVWPIAPPSAARSFNLHVFVHDLVGLRADASRFVDAGGLVVQMEWRGNRHRAEAYIRGASRSRTSGKPDLQAGGVVCWNEGFSHVCKLRGSSSGERRPFRSWMLHIAIHGFDFLSSSKAIVLGEAQIDVAQFAFEEGKTLRIPIKCNVIGVFVATELTVTLELFDLDPGRRDDRAGSTTSLFWSRNLRPRPQGQRKGDHVFSASQRKSFLSRFLSGGKFVAHSFSFRSRRGDSDFPEEEDDASDPRRSGLFRSDRDFDSSEDVLASSGSSSGDSPTQFILRQRQTAGGVRNVGGRVARTDSLGVLLHQSGVVSSGGEIGEWENKSVVSRDGGLELVTDVFFASIDQCNEKADGGGACAVLVAVIADWLLKNKKRLPTRSHLDELIREGSTEWRKLCEDDANRERFSDQHFDLETVLEAKVRPISAATTYVSFFSLEKMPDGLEHLRETMSFDSMWERNIAGTATTSAEERIYITNWNDHFFILKVEADAMYLIDTLGERLHEGCRRAYILRFDRQSVVRRLEEEEEGESGDGDGGRHGRVLCEGVGSCKEFIKGFLAALPLRELRSDIDRGFSGEVHVHRRLQIEFHRAVASGR